MKKILSLIITTILILQISTGCQKVNHNYKETNEELEFTGPGCLVLNYHRINVSNPLNKFFIKYSNNSELQLYSIFTNEFIEQMEFFKKHNAHFLTIEELESHLYNKTKLPAKSVLLTFDDADITLYKNAFPYLKKEQIPFTVFIISGQVGNKYQGLKLCTWDQLKEINDSGLAVIGSHTYNFHYKDADGKPAFLNDNTNQEFQEDTIKSIEEIKKHLGFKPKYFCYPYGFGNPRTDSILQDAGMKLLFSLRPGLVTSEDPPHFIKRLLVTRYNWSSVEKWLEQNN